MKQFWNSSSVVERIAWANSCNPGNILSWKPPASSFVGLVSLKSSNKPKSSGSLMCEAEHFRWLWRHLYKWQWERLVVLLLKKQIRYCTVWFTINLHTSLAGFPLVLISVLACVNAFQQINIWVLLQVKNILRIEIRMRKLPSQMQNEEPWKKNQNSEAQFSWIFSVNCSVYRSTHSLDWSNKNERADQQQKKDNLKAKKVMTEEKWHSFRLCNVLWSK